MATKAELAAAKRSWWERIVGGATIVSALPIAAPFVIAIAAGTWAWFKEWDPFGAVIFCLLTFTCLVVMVIGGLHLKRHFFPIPPPPARPVSVVAEVFARPGNDNALPLHEALALIRERRGVSAQEARRMVREKAAAGALALNGRQMANKRVSELPDDLSMYYWTRSRLTEAADHPFDEGRPLAQTEFDKASAEKSLGRFERWDAYTAIRVDYLDFIELWPKPRI